MNIYRNIDRDKVQFDFLVHYREDQFYDEEIRKLGGHIYKLSVREDYHMLRYWRELNAFFREHPYDVVHGHMDTLGFFYLAAAARNGVPVRIAHAHTDYVQNGVKKVPRLLMIRLYQRYANRRFACSEQAGHFMFGNDPFRVIHNGIDLGKYDFDPEVRDRVRGDLDLGKRLVIGSVGRFHVVKNQLFLLDILQVLHREIPDVLLLLVGGGEMEQEIRARVQELNLGDNVRILQNRKDVNELYQAMDVFLLPSLFEGIPLVGIEAQTSGLPCIFSDRVNRETAVTGNVEFLSIDRGPDLWKEQILRIRKGYERCSCRDEVKNAGYSSSDVSRMLEHFYLRASSRVIG